MNKESGYRKFIIVQLPEICKIPPKAFEAGYKTIAGISKDRIRKVIKKIEKEKAEKQICLTMATSFVKYSN
jgi:adenine-specific DNA-methyltransferase